MSNPLSWVDPGGNAGKVVTIVGLLEQCRQEAKRLTRNLTDSEIILLRCAIQDLNLELDKRC